MFPFLLSFNFLHPSIFLLCLVSFSSIYFSVWPFLLSFTFLYPPLSPQNLTTHTALLTLPHRLGSGIHFGRRYFTCHPSFPSKAHDWQAHARWECPGRYVEGGRGEQGGSYITPVIDRIHRWASFSITWSKPYYFALVSLFLTIVGAWV